ncbi:hypothetical protein [Hydrococcus rivularis]|uniref:hypothetical protein n=1 Tax=Hydrococcus rivularis TaxID=1616834 RepID=UPI0015881A53|nr:hypothetical protein [Hydrococcus rivularis]
MYVLVDVVWIVAEPPQLVERVRGSSRWVGTFAQAFDIIFDIDVLILQGLAEGWNLLSINCVHFCHNCHISTQFVTGAMDYAPGDRLQQAQKKGYEKPLYTSTLLLCLLNRESREYDLRRQQ